MEGFPLLNNPLFLTAFLVLGVYLLVRIIKKVYKVLSELLVAYQLFSGESYHRSTKRPLRLYTFFCKTNYLDEVAINELHSFISAGIQSESESSIKETIQEFHQTVLSYSHILLFREKIDGTLRGVTMCGIDHHKDYTLIKLGVMLFKDYYRGGPLGYLAFAYIFLKELIFHPFTPLFVVGKSFGYKSYLIATKFKESYPRYDRETPDHFKQILKEYALSIKGKADVYNEDTSILIQERTHLKENLLTITEKDLENPHIKFFVERNPGWTKGHYLIGGYKLTWADLHIFSTDMVNGLVTSKKKPKKVTSASGASDQPNIAKRRNRPVPKLCKRYTFQDLTANRYAVNMCEMDMFGDILLSSNQLAWQDQPTVTSPTTENVDLNVDLSDFKL